MPGIADVMFGKPTGVRKWVEDRVWKNPVNEFLSKGGGPYGDEMRLALLMLMLNAAYAQGNEIEDSGRMADEEGSILEGLPADSASGGGFGIPGGSEGLRELGPLSALMRSLGTGEDPMADIRRMIDGQDTMAHAAFRAFQAMPENQEPQYGDEDIMEMISRMDPAELEQILSIPLKGHESPSGGDWYDRIRALFENDSPRVMRGGTGYRLR